MKGSTRTEKLRVQPSFCVLVPDFRLGDGEEPTTLDIPKFEKLDLCVRGGP